MKFFVLCLVLATSQASTISLVPHISPVSAVIKGASASSASADFNGASATYVEGATIARVGHGSVLLSSGIAPAIVAPIASAIVAAPGPIVVSHGTGAVIAGPSGTVATSNGLGLGVAPIVSKTVFAPAAAKTVLVGGHGIW